MNRKHLHCCVRAAVSADRLVSEDLIESCKANEDVDNGHYSGVDELAESIAEGLKEPVQTSDDEEDECDFVNHEFI